jgi:sugar phosphate isomerase/epimerase
LAYGRELGAKRAVTHIIDPDRNRAIDALGRLCEMAAQHELDVAIEMCPLTPGCADLEQGVWIVDQVGRSNLGLGIDPLHIVRSGAGAKEVAGLGTRYISYAQINDGHGLAPSADYFGEAHNRELPGDGDFPLHDLLSALPAATPVEVEIPNDKRQEAGRPASDYCGVAYVRSRKLLDGLKPTR